MSSRDDEFDLDVRLMGTSDLIPQFAPDRFHPELFAGDPEPGEPTVAPAATCPADTCGMDCQTQGNCPTNTCDMWTCGCNTSETCENPLCGSDAITFGSYCIDDSGGEDTCSACPGGGGEEPETAPPCG
jgi:hypothetical protein